MNVGMLPAGVGIRLDGSGLGAKASLSTTALSVISSIAAGRLVEFRLGFDEVLGRQRRLRQGIELGLEVIERWLEREAHLHAAALAFGLSQRLLQRQGARPVPRQHVRPRLGNIPAGARGGHMCAEPGRSPPPLASRQVPPQPRGGGRVH